jgi:c-di-GMP-binding flagellar brake protein YcgR
MAHNTEQRQERRENPRLKLRVPFELCAEGSGTPIRGSTSDLSLGGCYIETIFPFPLNTTLELILQINSTVVVVGKVVTCDPNVGNGIKFTRLLPEDREELRSY